MTITGGLQVVTAAPDDSDYGFIGSAEETLYAAGDTITVDVSGADDIPAHTLTATAPADVTIVAPAVAEPGPSVSLVTVDRAQELFIEWSNGSTGSVGVALLSHDAHGERITSVSCTAEASAGMMTIPSAVLSRLLATGAETTTGMTMKVFDSGETTAGDCVVSLMIEGTAASPDGYLLQGPAIFL